MANSDYLAELRELLEDCGVGEICFYPMARAYSEALEITGVP
ncbi:MAG: hypothetical protein V8S95_09310 [Odoribacter sp.]